MGFEEESEMAHEEIKMYLYALMEDAFMNRLYDIHQEKWGIPCGPPYLPYIRLTDVKEY